MKELKEIYDLSIRQIERLTGINRGIVAKAKLVNNPVPMTKENLVDLS